MRQSLSTSAPKPRTRPNSPAYPTILAMAALALAGCGGAVDPAATGEGKEYSKQQQTPKTEPRQELPPPEGPWGEPSGAAPAAYDAGPSSQPDARTTVPQPPEAGPPEPPESPWGEPSGAAPAPYDAGPPVPREGGVRTAPDAEPWGDPAGDSAYAYDAGAEDPTCDRSDGGLVPR